MRPSHGVMERSALPQIGPRVPSWPRAARRSEWLRSALAHHYWPEASVENEIVVLATGIDQYLQEVFHHLLALPGRRDDTLPAEDFAALCGVLGLRGARRTGTGTGTTGGPAEDGGDGGDEELLVACCGQLPEHLSFKDFHSRLCGYFRVRSARGGGDRGGGGCWWRLPVTEETELVERHIRLRWPRHRRRKCESFDPAVTGHRGAASQTGRVGAASERDSDEAAALRELVEDLRSALQGSDARCLALEVALRKERSRRISDSTPSTKNTVPTLAAAAAPAAPAAALSQGKLVPTLRIRGRCGRDSRGGARGPAVVRRDLRDPLIRELNLIRSSRDGQLAEAIKFSGHLEEELQRVYQEVEQLQAVELALRRENACIRRRTQEAREALRSGLDQVRLLQQKAQQVPQLQAGIVQLETQLLQYRSNCKCIADPSYQQKDSHGAEDTSKTAPPDCLQRAVEGRAASDEEGEEDGRPREEEPIPEGKKQTGRLRSCGSRLHANPSSGFRDSRGRCDLRGQNLEQPGGSAVFEKEKIMAPVSCHLAPPYF